MRTDEERKTGSLDESELSNSKFDANDDFKKLPCHQDSAVFGKNGLQQLLRKQGLVAELPENKDEDSFFESLGLQMMERGIYRSKQTKSDVSTDEMIRDLRYQVVNVLQSPPFAITLVAQSRHMASNMERFMKVSYDQDKS
eukprot:751156-Hanusia_phi.AAC.5